MKNDPNTSIPEHPLWLVHDAIAEVDGCESPAFQKALAAFAALEKRADALLHALETEWLAHHRSGDTVSKPCGDIPKYRTRA